MDNTIRVGERRIRPLFDLAAWDAFDREHGSLSEMLKRLDSEDSDERRRATLDAALILCNNAIEASAEEAAAKGKMLEEGEKQLITRRELMRAVPPKRVPDVRMACISAIANGMRSDYDQADNEPVDVVLEEIEKKQNPGG